ncbi:CrcB family protein [Niallia sp.]|uniref:fluoride efflux transporter FluC n=1 Tax=Niallia sp. TaxID=2837523 RepID=UPI0028977401|nr:CrcB family protein [Niallia sp.]
MSYIYVGLGGVIGSIIRYLVGQFPFPHEFPLQTLVINIIGSFLLGWFTSAIIKKQRIKSEFATAIGTGMIGSFTTLSTLSMDTVNLITAGSYLLACEYVLGSAIFGFVFASMGLKLGERKWSRSNA